MSAVTGHPLESMLRMDRMPHIWCPGCGIGTAVNCFMRAVKKTEIDQDKVVVVSGIGCTGRVAGYVNFDSFHATHGRAIPFASGVKLANQDLTVVVFSGDGDLFAIGGNHFIHAARRNVNIKIFCINNFIYGMTGGQTAPTTPLGAKTSTSPYGNYEPPFNLSHLAESSGATYVARWTTHQIKKIESSMAEALTKKGFAFIEIVSGCPTVYSKHNKLGTGSEMVAGFRNRCVIRNAAETEDIPLGTDSEIVTGKFVDVERPTFLDYEKRF